MTVESATTTMLFNLFEAFNRHDLDAVLEFFIEDCAFITASGPERHGARIEGKGAVACAFANVWKDMPDARWAEHRHFACGNRAVSEWIFSGTSKTGGYLEVEGCDLFTLQGGKIAEKQAFRKMRTQHEMRDRCRV